MKEYHVIGIDDSPFTQEDTNVLVVGAVMRGKTLEGVISTKIERDGEDATIKLIELIQNCKYKHLHCIFLDGIAVGGFNVINPQSLSERTDIPVMTIMREEPRWEEFYKALEKLGMNKKKTLIQKLPRPEKVNNIWIQRFNIEKKEALKLLEATIITSHVPEALRVAHLIAGGIIRGQSNPRA